MTQPTFKPTAMPSGKQDAPASVMENNGIQTHVSKQKKYDNDPQSSVPVALDKAALLALFTLPIDELLVTTDDFVETSDTNVASQRVTLYRTQHDRTRLLYMAPTNTRPTYLVQTLKPQFAEYQHYMMAQQLDKRGLLDTSALERLWQQLHVVDDIIADIVHHMPAQQPAGWQLTAQEGHNPLRLPSVGKLKQSKPIQDQASLNSYVLGHFGVSSFTYDRGYYIGHVVGYLFSCYFCAHLSISYSVTALGEQAIGDYDYASLETPHMVRLLQGLDGYCKKRIYQLAVICARLSVYATDKRIEKMLIAEVNDFDKKLQQQHLDVLLLQGMMPDSSDSTPLF